MGEDLRWGVVGCGWVARDFAIPAIRAAAGGRLAAVCDLDVGRAAAAAPGTPAFARPAEMLASGLVDAVYVATPNHLHAEPVTEAARHGAHVLCEKPIAHDLDDAQAMVAACEAAGVVYATAFDQRFHAAHRQMARLIADGAIGTVTQIQIRYACWVDAGWSGDNWRADPARAGGGAAIDLAPHGLDLCATLLGAPLVSVSAMLQRRVHGYAVDDGGVLMAAYADGTLATLSVGYNCPERLERRRLAVWGTDAMLVAENTMGQTPGGRLVRTDAASGAAEELALEDDRSPFTVQIERFNAHVAEGAPFPGGAAGDLAQHRLLIDALDRAALDHTAHDLAGGNRHAS
ncbi:MAG: Gfo/Idh/MocA family protein [Paracoccaceae bacterium]